MSEQNKQHGKFGTILCAGTGKTNLSSAIVKYIVENNIELEIKIPNQCSVDNIDLKPIDIDDNKFHVKTKCINNFKHRNKK